MFDSLRGNFWWFQGLPATPWGPTQCWKTEALYPCLPLPTFYTPCTTGHSNVCSKTLRMRMNISMGIQDGGISWWQPKRMEFTPAGNKDDQNIGTHRAKCKPHLCSFTFLRRNSSPIIISGGKKSPSLNLFSPVGWNWDELSWFQAHCMDFNSGKCSDMMVMGEV